MHIFAEKYTLYALASDGVITIHYFKRDWSVVHNRRLN